MSGERAISYVPLDDVRPADRNPKRHDHATLSASMRRFGFVEPMVRDDRTGRLVAGHGRLDELRMARARDALSPPAGVRVDESGSWLVPLIVGWSSRDDGEAQAYIVATNRAVETGGWDDDVLTDLLLDLEAQGVGALDGIGFSEDEVLAMLSQRLGVEGDDDGGDASPQLDGQRYRLVVDCDDEQHQAATMVQLETLGLVVRAVVN